MVCIFISLIALNLVFVGLGAIESKFAAATLTRTRLNGSCTRAFPHGLGGEKLTFRASKDQVLLIGYEKLRTVV